MASLDSLPADQRAVLQLVLQRGRSYDQIAAMLSIDRAAVRQRALSAFDALGPQTRVASERRALITDYLLGQLPPRVAEQTRDRLGESATERAWARVLAGELAPLAKEPLPEIPTEAGGRRAPEREADEAEAERPAGTRRTTRPRRREPAPEPIAATAGMAAVDQPAGGGDRIPPDDGLRGPETDPAAARASSRRGGAILLGLGALAAAIIVAIVIIASGGSSHKHSGGTTSPATTSPATTSPATTSPATTTPASTSPSATATTSTTATATTKLVGRVTLTSPTGSKTTAGVAEVLQRGTALGLVLVGEGIPANTKHDAYAVWLYNSAHDAVRLGFVNPSVKADGKLQTASPLPANTAHFKRLLLTLETTAEPKVPGKIVLEGPLSISG
jgi:hypothetical protein